MFGNKKNDWGVERASQPDNMEHAYATIMEELQSLQVKSEQLNQNLASLTADIQSATTYLEQKRHELSQWNIRKTGNAINDMRAKYRQCFESLTLVETQAQHLAYTLNTLTTTNIFGEPPNIEA